MPSIIDIVIGLNHEAVDEGVNHIREQVAEMKEGFTSAIAEFASVGFLAELSEKTMEYGHQVNALSERLGINAEWIQKVANVGKLYDTDMQATAFGLNKLVVAQQKAINGSTEQTEAFARFGISLAQLKTMHPDEVFNALADATMNAKDRGEAYGDVITLMGRNAGVLFPMLEKGSKAIQEQGEAMGVMSTDSVKSLEEADRHIKIFEQQVVVSFGNAISIASRATSAIALVFTEAIGESSAWMAQATGDSERAEQIMQNLAKVRKDTQQYIYTGVDPNAPKEKAGAIDEDRETGEEMKDAAKKAKEEAKEQAKAVKEAADYARESARALREAKVEELKGQEKIDAIFDDMVEASKHLNEGTDSEKLQKLKDYDAMNRQLIAAGKSADQQKMEAARTLAEMQERYQDRLESRARKADDDAFENRFRAIQNEGDRKTALLEREKQLEKELANIPTPAADKMFAKLDEINTIKDRIAEANARPGKGVVADSMARIGGGGNVAGIGTMEKQLNETKEMNRTLKDIKSILGPNNSAGGGLANVSLNP